MKILFVGLLLLNSLAARAVESCETVLQVRLNTEIDTPNAKNEKVKIAKTAWPTPDSVDNFLYAYHLTDFPPINGMIKNTIENRFRFSITTHFSLGEPVIDHSYFSWSQKRYGIMVPIKFLRPQMLNLDPQDTFIIGSFELPNEAILFMPMEEPIPEGFHGTVVRYNSNQKIKDAMIEETQKRHSIQFRALNGGEPGAPVIWKNIDINSTNNKRIFFSDFYQTHPYLTSVNHAETPVGIIDLIFVDYFAQWFSTGQLRNGYGLEIKLTLWDLKKQVLSLNDAITEFKRIFNQMKINKNGIIAFEEGFSELNGYLNLINAEIELREKLGKSFLTSGSQIHKKLMAARNDIIKIQEILENDATLLSGAPIDQGHSPTPLELWNILRFSDLGTLTKYFEQFYPKRDERTQKFITHLLLKRVIELLQREQISPESAANYLLTNFHLLSIEEVKGNVDDTIRNWIWSVEKWADESSSLRTVFRRTDILKLMAKTGAFKIYFDNPSDWQSRQIESFIRKLNINLDVLQLESGAGD